MITVEKQFSVNRGGSKKQISISFWIKILGILIFLIGRPDSTWAQGTIVPNNIFLGQPPAAPPGTYIRQNQYPGPAGGLFALNLTTISAGQYQLTYYGIAEIYSIHAAAQGLAFTPAYVNGNPPLLDNTGNNSGPLQFSLAVGESLLLAYWDDALYVNPPPPGTSHGAPDVYDAYGWFRLTRQGSGLVIADSATAFGNGIFVGTYNAVPEPATLSLIALASLGLLARRHR